jgi:hypothetical protein
MGIKTSKIRAQCFAKNYGALDALLSSWLKEFRTDRPSLYPPFSLSSFSSITGMWVGHEVGISPGMQWCTRFDDKAIKISKMSLAVPQATTSGND